MPVRMWGDLLKDTLPPVLRQLSAVIPHTPSRVLAGPLPLAVHTRPKGERCLPGGQAHDISVGLQHVVAEQCSLST